MAAAELIQDREILGEVSADVMNASCPQIFMPTP